MMTRFWSFRLIFLLILFELRLIVPQINGLLIEEGRRVRVVGDVIKIKQSISNCKAEVGRFLFEIEGKCSFSQRDRISIIGITDRGVTEVFFGQIRLTSAIIDVLEKRGERDVFIDRVPGFFKKIREKIRHRFERILPSFEAGLVSGMITGDKEGLSKDAYQAMIDSGTIHIIVASGYNVMLVAGAVMSLLFWIVKRPRAVAITLITVLMYTLLSGGDPPVVRASIMAGVMLLGEVWGRRSVSWWSLLLAGWIMVMINPLELINASFQLSMAASVGLMVVYPAIMKLFVGKTNRLIELLDRSGLMTTMATMLTTAPIIWWHFSRVSIVGLLSNLLVLPLVSVIMILGMATLIFGPLTAPFLYAAAHWVVVVIEFFSKGRMSL